METMNWNEAAAILKAHQHGTLDDHAALLDAVRVIYNAVEPHCWHDTEGMHDWLEAGEWDDPVTPEEIASQWDDICDQVLQ